MKKLILLLLIIFPINIYANELASNAKSSILIEYSTGKILYEKNSNEKRAPASMTKLMTLLLTMEALDKKQISLEDEVLISKNASSMGGSQVYLDTNTKVKLNDLLKSIAIASANDSAVAIAEYISGSTSNFVELMNKKAQSLGLKNTNFKNVHGLDDKDHYSSAKDMALIARELLKYENILNYTSIYESYFPKQDGSSIWMINTNKLIKYYKGMDGLKTGYTTSAGYCITATANRNNMRLISVVMGEETSEIRNDETIELLNYGFSNYKLKTILDTKDDLGKISIKNGKKEEVNIKIINKATNLEKINDNNNYDYKVDINEVKAPVKIGDIVGELIIFSNNKEINRIGITVTEDIKKANIIDLYIRNFKKIISGKI